MCLLKFMGDITLRENDHLRFVITNTAVNTATSIYLSLVSMHCHSLYK